MPYRAINRLREEGVQVFTGGDQEVEGNPPGPFIIELFGQKTVNIQNDQAGGNVFRAEIGTRQASLGAAPSMSSISGILRPDQRMAN